MKNYEQLSNILKLGIIAIILFAGAQYIQAFGPSGTNCTPPNCNLVAPLNVGSSTQQKIGDIQVNNFTAQSTLNKGSLVINGFDIDGVTPLSIGALIANGRVLIGTTTIVSSLKTQIAGNVGASAYCDTAGNNCTSASTTYATINNLASVSSSTNTVFLSNPYTYVNPYSGTPTHYNDLYSTTSPAYTPLSSDLADGSPNNTSYLSAEVSLPLAMLKDFIPQMKNEPRQIVGLIELCNPIIHSAQSTWFAIHALGREYPNNISGNMPAASTQYVYIPSGTTYNSNGNNQGDLKYLFDFPNTYNATKGSFDILYQVSLYNGSAMSNSTSLQLSCTVYGYITK